jgi:hypothetical protein
MVVQNQNHRSYKFAKRFTEVYEELSKIYPIFARLKKIALAISLAQYMWLNKIPIDL